MFVFWGGASCEASLPARRSELTAESTISTIAIIDMLIAISLFPFMMVIAIAMIITMTVISSSMKPPRAVPCTLVPLSLLGMVAVG